MQNRWEQVTVQFETEGNGQNETVKPGPHEKKQLSKKAREAVSSAVSSHVRVHFGEIFASRGRETNIYRV